MASSKVQQERQFLSSRTTLTRFLLKEARHIPGATGEFSALMTDLASASKMIAMYVNKGPKLGVLGVEDTGNVTGDTQKTLDVLTHDIMVHCMEASGMIRMLCSEESETVEVFQNATGKYLLATDPLDGSSNIDVNVSVGTIFGILRIPEGATVMTPELFLQQGRKQIAAGYVLYGPQTTMMLTTGAGVNGFTLDQDVGEFYLTHPNCRVPEDCKEYAINCSRRRFWEPAIQRYVNECDQGKDGPRKKDFGMRYVGSMVADVHRILHRGGIFMYPGDLELFKRGQTGKLRILYEVNPMSMLIEQAGGLSTTGRMRCLDYMPKKIHDKGPIILGSKNEILLIEQYHREQDEQAGGPPEIFKA